MKAWSLLGLTLALVAFAATIVGVVLLLRGALIPALFNAVFLAAALALLVWCDVTIERMIRRALAG